MVVHASTVDACRGFRKGHIYVTDTEKKLRDAETQFRLALQSHGDEETVRSCINAFIAHGRSVTLVMQAESGATGLPLRAWYDSRMAALLASPSAPLLRPI
jgi:hypothetical protein